MWVGETLLVFCGRAEADQACWASSKLFLGLDFRGNASAYVTPGESVNKSAASAASPEGFSSRDQVGC